MAEYRSIKCEITIRAHDSCYKIVSRKDFDYKIELLAEEDKTTSYGLCLGVGIITFTIEELFSRLEDRAISSLSTAVGSPASTILPSSPKVNDTLPASPSKATPALASKSSNSLIPRPSRAFLALALNSSNSLPARLPRAIPVLAPKPATSLAASSSNTTPATSSKTLDASAVTFIPEAIERTIHSALGTCTSELHNDDSPFNSVPANPTLTDLERWDLKNRITETRQTLGYLRRRLIAARNIQALIYYEGKIREAQQGLMYLTRRINGIANETQVTQEELMYLRHHVNDDGEISSA